MNNDFMVYVDKRLDEWAVWFSEGNFYGLGFPTSTHEYTLMTKGVHIKSTAPWELPYNQDAEEIEALVVELESQGANMAAALRKQYFGQGAFVDRAKQIGVSYQQFRICIGMARQWLAGRLSA